MPIEDIYSIRDRSKAWQAYKRKNTSCPWVTDEGEMIRKTVIRRAYKMWPIPSASAKQIERALDLDHDEHELDVTPMTSEKVELIDKITNKLELLGKTADSEKFLEYLARLYSRKIESIDSLTEYEMRKLIALLDQMKPKVEPKVELEIETELELEETNEEFTGDSGALSELQE